MPSVTPESQPPAPSQGDATSDESQEDVRRAGIPRRERPTRGRVTETLLIGVLTQTVIAMLWMANDRMQRPIYSLLFVFGIALASTVAQRRLEGMARLIWSLVGSFWASMAFWVVSVPLTLRSNPGFRNLSYPLFMARDGWYTASDLLPVVLTALTVGVVVGVAGWIVWSWKASRELQADIYEDSAAQAETVTRFGSAPTVPSLPLLQASVGQSDHVSSSQFAGVSDNSRDRWGPPPSIDSSD